jgi:V8-like Glu-specific endopeptidase
MAYSSVPKPLLVKQWGRALKTRKPQRATKDLVLHLDEHALPREYRKAAEFALDRRTGRIRIDIRTRIVGQHYFPPDIKSVSLSTRRRVATGAPDTSGIVHDHLAVSVLPAKLPRELRVRQRFLNLGRGREDMSDPSTVFTPDERYTFSDTSFPWCTCGKVETEAGWGSGVMIGPRHMMTASHVIVWKPNNTAGWVKFTPLKFDSSEPFGHAFATTIYSWNKADGSDQLDLTESAFDYVVCVLDSPMGNGTGWMGSRGYDTTWDGGDYWGSIGYPNDLSSGTRPSFVGFQDFIDEKTASLGGRSSFRIRHEIDVIPGQSGGPYFGFWAGEPWPRVVAIQSGVNLGGPGGDNTSSGGNPLSELISIARGAAP